MVLQRWDPFKDLMQMDDTINRLWRGIGGGTITRGGAEDWNIPLDVYQDEDGLVVKASMPGINPEDIDVSLEENVLTVKAEVKAEEEKENGRYLVRERRYGSFYRAIRLPETVDSGKVHSSFENGVLTITLPKAEEKKKKQIKVKVNKELPASKASDKK